MKKNNKIYYIRINIFQDKMKQNKICDYKNKVTNITYALYNINQGRTN